MRILILHSRYRSGATSGENRVVQDEAQLLREAGHSVHLWESPSEIRGTLDLARLGARAIWARSATNKLRELIRSFRPEIMHHHNLFPTLSPAVLRVDADAAELGTLHNFRHMCLPATLLRKGLPCEDCVGHSLAWPGIVHRCYRGSFAGSAALATSLALHRSLGSFDRPHLYLAVSDFIRRKYVDAGWLPEKIAVKSNFAWSTPRREGPGSYFLYGGRLAPEKGVATLLNAWDRISAKLVVAGDGPEGARLRGAPHSRVEFVGSVPPAKMTELLLGARALLVPSKGYEGQPRVILEACAAGVPVVASAVGGVPETVENGLSGLLVPPESVAEWRFAVERLLDDSEAERLGEGAFAVWRERYSPEVAVRNLEAAYAVAIERAA